MIKLGSQGREVIKWQRFLKLIPDGIFGTNTHNATVEFQQKNGLTPDGKVGSNTYRKAAEHGFDYVVSWWPPKPNFKTPSSRERERIFGKFDFEKINSSEIRILGNWVEKNIVTVNIPELMDEGIEAFPANGNIRLHRLAVKPFQGFIADAKTEGHLDLIISWAGSFYPRMVRGSSRSLSNHSWGTAFDINAPWNWLNRQPAPEGAKGTLLRLVPIANAHGFYWGGHYSRRKDGMHFELARI